MSGWSLPKMLASLNIDVERKLETSRWTLGHPVAKGDASERVWLSTLQEYLPKRYKADRAYVVDSQGNVSDQLDIVIFDRHFSPFIFRFENETVVPAESVYAVFEAKQSINAEHVAYAQAKIASVRRLHRTSLPIPHAGGTFDPRPLIPILGGVLTLESDWSPPLGEALEKALIAGLGDCRLNLGCVAAHGHFVYVSNDEQQGYEVVQGGMPATAFLFRLISLLQASGTVPMIDVNAYAQWIREEVTAT